MEFTQTIRGKRKLFSDGFSYIVDKNRDTTTYCRRELKDKCKGRLTTKKK